MLFLSLCAVDIAIFRVIFWPFKTVINQGAGRPPHPVSRATELARDPCLPVTLGDDFEEHVSAVSTVNMQNIILVFITALGFKMHMHALLMTNCEIVKNISSFTFTVENYSIL